MGANEGIPPQTVTGGLGDGPFLWLQLTDDNGRPLISEIFLGRCDRGSFTSSVDLAVSATALAVVTATECESVSRPSVSVDAATALAGVNGKLLFRSSDLVGVPPARTDEAVVDLVMLPGGRTFEFPQQARSCPAARRMGCRCPS